MYRIVIVIVLVICHRHKPIDLKRIHAEVRILISRLVSHNVMGEGDVILSQPIAPFPIFIHQISWSPSHDKLRPYEITFTVYRVGSRDEKVGTCSVTLLHALCASSASLRPVADSEALRAGEAGKASSGATAATNAASCNTTQTAS
jgi:hypothetical protein